MSSITAASTPLATFASVPDVICNLLRPLLVPKLLMDLATDSELVVKVPVLPSPASAWSLSAYRAMVASSVARILRSASLTATYVHATDNRRSGLCRSIEAKTRSRLALRHSEVR